jgi:glycosyltransferase involved in cell wall biosynthesis
MLTSEHGITMLVPVKNGINFLPELLQTLENHWTLFDEILIIDDHSTDGSRLKLETWAEESKCRIRILTNNGSGLVDALNYGLSQSGSDWIARYDIDDVYSPNRLLDQRRYIDGGVVAIFCDYQITSTKKFNLGLVPAAIFAPEVALSLVSGQRTPHPGVLFYLPAALRAGGYQKQDYPAEDLGLWMRMSKDGNLVSVPKTLVRYRLSVNSITGANREIAITKRKHLTGIYGMEFNTSTLKIADIVGTLEKYNAHTLAKIRKYLYLLDLWKITHFSTERFRDRSVVVALGLKELLSFGGILAALQLITGFLARRFYRRIKPIHLKLSARLEELSP